MNISEFLIKSGEGAGLKKAVEADVLIGEKSGFLVQYVSENPSDNVLKIVFSAKRDNPLTEEEQKKIKEKYPVKKFKLEDTCIAMIIKNEMLFTDKFAEKVSNMLNTIMDDFAAMGFVPCCQNCKENKKIWAYYIGGYVANYCEECGTKAYEEAKAAVAAEKAKPENFVKGIIGAVIGAVIGGLFVILLTKVGRIAALSGAITMWLSLTLYKKLSSKLSVRGIAVSALLSLAAIAAGYYIGLIWAVAGETKLPFGIVRDILSKTISEDSDLKGRVIKEVLLLIVFAALGAFSVIKGMSISADEEATVEKLTLSNCSSSDEIK